jgi:hypothetical protein
LVSSKYHRFYKNGNALANLERIKIRDNSSTTAIKSYVDGTELISPQAKKIINE